MSNIAGLKLIVPTSVAGTGVSVSTTGKVTFTTATSISINGCFSATYDNYLIILRGTNPNSADIRFRLRSSGTDSTTGYTYQYIYVNGTSVTGGRGTFSSFSTAYGFSGQYGGSHIYLYGPFLSQPTAHRTVSAAAGSSGPVVYDFAETHNASSSYDGLTFLPDNGSVTGALTIYGLSQ